MVPLGKEGRLVLLVIVVHKALLVLLEQLGPLEKMETQGSQEFVAQMEIRVQKD